MSWLSGLFGGKPPPPAPNTVVIDAGIAATLVADGSQLGVAVNAALTEYIEAKTKAVAEHEARGIPFWLRRDSARSRDIEDDLRDRVIHRHSGEEGGG